MTVPTVAEALAAVVRVPTVSRPGGAADPAAFAALRAALAQAFPRVHAGLPPEVVAGASLLFTWPSRERAAAPVVLLAHQDVVPPGDEAAWRYPPFAGAIADGQVWGRGTLDFKCGLVAQLQAAEELLAEGHVPRRTVLLAYGHDEEIGGAAGAAALARTLAERGTRPAFVLDEGLAITSGIAPGADRPVAFIGIAEKGWVNVELVARGAPGHAATPPAQTAAGILAAAVVRVEAAPMPARIGPVADLVLSGLAEVARPPFAAALRLRRVLAPLLVRRLAHAPATNALLRSTIAVTILRAGELPNVLPEEARAVANVRLLPGATPDDAVRHITRVVADGRVTVQALAPAAPPPPVSAAGTPAFRLIAECVRAVAPEAHVVPGLVLGGTDSRHYTTLTDRVYRFAPQRVDPATLALVHAPNERIAVADLERMVSFYTTLIRRADYLEDS